MVRSLWGFFAPSIKKIQMCCVRDRSAYNKSVSCSLYCTALTYVSVHSATKWIRTAVQGADPRIAWDAGAVQGTHIFPCTDGLLLPYIYINNTEHKMSILSIVFFFYYCYYFYYIYTYLKISNLCVLLSACDFDIKRYWSECITWCID